MKFIKAENKSFCRYVKSKPRGGGAGVGGYSNIVEQHRLGICFGGVLNFEFLCFCGRGGGVEILRIIFRCQF